MQKQVRDRLDTAQLVGVLQYADLKTCQYSQAAVWEDNAGLDTLRPAMEGLGGFGRTDTAGKSEDGEKSEKCEEGEERGVGLAGIGGEQQWPEQAQSQGHQDTRGASVRGFRPWGVRM